MTHRQQIGQQLANIRKKRGLTVRQLAELSGVNYTNVGKIERGAYNVSIDILGKICDAMKTKISIEPYDL